MAQVAVSIADRDGPAVVAGGRIRLESRELLTESRGPVILREVDAAGNRAFEVDMPGDESLEFFGQLFRRSRIIQIDFDFGRGVCLGR